MTTEERDIALFLNQLHERLEDVAVSGRTWNGRRTSFNWREQGLAKEWEKREKAKLAELERRAEQTMTQFEQKAADVIVEIERPLRNGKQLPTPGARSPEPSASSGTNWKAR